VKLTKHGAKVSLLLYYESWRHSVILYNNGGFTSLTMEEVLWLVCYGYKVGFNSRCHREEGLQNLLRPLENRIEEIKEFGYAFLRRRRSQVTNHYESGRGHNQTGEDW